MISVYFQILLDLVHFSNLHLISIKVISFCYWCRFWAIHTKIVEKLEKQCLLSALKVRNISSVLGFQCLPLFLSVHIPDAAFIQAARRKRQLARTQDDYIPLNVKHTSTMTGMKENSDEDPESEPDDHEKRIPFTPKPQTLRQRMAEETSTYLIYLQHRDIKAFFIIIW